MFIIFFENVHRFVQSPGRLITNRQLSILILGGLTKIVLVFHHFLNFVRFWTKRL